MSFGFWTCMAKMVFRLCVSRYLDFFRNWPVIKVICNTHILSIYTASSHAFLVDIKYNSAYSQLEFHSAYYPYAQSTNVQLKHHKVHLLYSQYMSNFILHILKYATMKLCLYPLIPLDEHTTLQSPTMKLLLLLVSSTR